MEGEQRLTVGWADWLQAATVLPGVLFCAQFPFFVGASFARMFADFGSALPIPTELALTTWFPLALGAVPLAVAAIGLAAKLPSKDRGVLFAIALVLSITAIGLLLWAVYLPNMIFTGAIK